MSGSYDGIGFVFAEDGGLAGVDLDHCLRDGELEPKAAAIVEALSSYTEYSVSGTGLHVIAQASLKHGIRTSSYSRIDIPVEIYSRGRYFTVTGKPYGDNSGIADGQKVIDYLSGVILPQADAKPAKEPQSKRRYLDNGEIIKKAMSSRNGDKFKRLWEGDTSMHGGDDSRADAALIRLLLFWTDGDKDRADFLFRQSGLYREEKWDKRPDYRKRTFDFVTGAGRSGNGRG
jgi:putative DNA primase/helicase